MDFLEGKKKVSGLDTNTYIVRSLSDFEGAISASRIGVEIAGKFIISDWEKDGQAFAKALTDAWKDHLAIKPKLMADIPKGFKP